MKAQRILAVIGLILIVTSIVLMLVGMFAGAAKELLLQISLISFLGAAGILLGLSISKKHQSGGDSNETTEE